MTEFMADFRWYDALGIIGSLLIAGAYYAVSSKLMDAENPPYQYANLAGSILLLVSLSFRPNTGAILIESLWAAIAVFILARYYLKHR